MNLTKLFNRLAGLVAFVVFGAIFLVLFLCTLPVLLGYLLVSFVLEWLDRKNKNERIP